MKQKIQSLIFFFLLISIYNLCYADSEKLKSQISELTSSTVMIFCYENIDGKKVSKILGSGFIVSSDGIIVTANHVVQNNNQFKSIVNEKGETNIEIEFRENIHCKFANDDIYQVRVLSEKELKNNVNIPLFFDYAILEIVNPKSEFNFLTFGKYNSVYVGQTVLFAGFPFAKPNLTIHKGMVSAKYLDKSLVSTDSLVKWIQIDGSVNKGNSGGPVIEIETGNVIGIINTRMVGISKNLFYLKNKLDSINKSGTGIIYNKSLNPNELIVELVNSLDWTISVGIGQAVSTDYIKNDIDFRRATGR